MVTIGLCKKSNKGVAMKKSLCFLVSVFMLSGCIGSESNANGKKMPTRFQSVPMEQAQLLQEGKSKIFCAVCGMTLPMFYKTNHAANVHGHTEQFCSIHCLAKSMNNNIDVKNPQVVNNETLKFMDAKKAWYVVGSKKAGTMSAVSKYAFEHKEKAEAFKKAFGGKVMNYDTTLTLVKKGLESESKKITKKQGMMIKKGEEMYAKLCKPTDQKFNSIADAKAYLKGGSCGQLNGKQLQAIGLYLNSK